MLQREYGPYCVPKEDMKLTLIKFERAFEQQARFEDEKQPNLKPDLMQIHYRNQEAISIQAQFDRVIVIFTTLLKDI
ncbi:hypothetical protein RhiirC2_793473 [Rhizophagus irregularis]|uniref:Arp2/3 complex 34 kDa subunit n=1 Tax=Rhizophagus irregularis TaxID=588596 RepID=A0A2N1MFB1_9GLOM|nr:hypothetical protein RhiirC2_793473 [Rhizophagus irregularis]